MNKIYSWFLLILIVILATGALMAREAQVTSSMECVPKESFLQKMGSGLHQFLPSWKSIAFVACIVVYCYFMYVPRVRLAQQPFNISAVSLVPGQPLVTPPLAHVSLNLSQLLPPAQSAPSIYTPPALAYSRYNNAIQNLYVAQNNAQNAAQRVSLAIARAQSSQQV